MLRKGWCGKRPSPCRHSTSPCATPLETRVGVETTGEAAIRPPKSRANIGFPANTCKYTQFSTSQILGFIGILAFVHYLQLLWKLGLARRLTASRLLNPQDELRPVDTSTRTWANCYLEHDESSYLSGGSSIRF